MIFRFAAADAPALSLHLLEPDGLESFLKAQTPEARAWAAAVGFSATQGEICLLPGPDGSCAGALFGIGGPDKQDRTRFVLAQAAAALPKGTWKIETDLPPARAREAAFGWLMAGYRFTRYAGTDSVPAQLVAPAGIDAVRVEAEAAGEALTRDLINTPSNDMGPAELEAAARALADRFGARFDSIVGDDLLASNFPLIHAVGRASPRLPRLLDMRWGNAGPRLTLVGKGICFDTGGLNLKPGGSMGLMKKDMGGAAAALGLAQMIMSLGLNLQLRVLIPAAENSVSGASFRPQDILTSRRGLTVEINNTDAEGRLVLADALALADEDRPDLLVSMATLTGAARVAMGPDVAPFFTDDDPLAAALAQAGVAAHDPVWRMPLHRPYEPLIEPGIADLDNAPSGGFGGAITAALFLRRFVGNAHRYLHFDIYGWQPAAAPARPKGGVGQGGRALLEALPAVLDLA